MVTQVAPEVVRFRFTVEEYEQMIATGILTEDDRVELIWGEIVEMSPINVRHAAVVKRLNAYFTTALAGRAIVGIQDPIRLGNDSEPQPDLTLLRPRDDYYASGHPGPEDVWLLVEVADTTLNFDRSVKLPLYAGAGITEVWIVNLADDRIEVYRRPQGDAYRTRRSAAPGEVIAPELFADLSVAVDDIVGRSR